MRINKFLAECGIASRRKCEEVILSGKVKINGTTVTNLSTVVTQDDLVTVDERAVRPDVQKSYLMFNKPKGCVTTVSDDRGRKTVFDYIDKKIDRLFPVGRLDYETEGLLLLTNDGDFANLLMHPSSGIEKTYVAKIEGKMLESELIHLAQGVMLDGRLTNPARVRLLDYDETFSRVEVVISEGRNRQVRRMFEAIGRKVDFLKRTQVGALKLGGLSRGEYRPLTEREIGYFLLTSDKTKRSGETKYSSATLKTNKTEADAKTTETNVTKKATFSPQTKKYGDAAKSRYGTANKTGKKPFTAMSKQNRSKDKKG